MRAWILMWAALAAQVPQVWTDEAVKRMEVPLVRPEYTPRHISAEDYYRIPERKIYRAYPVYHPSREPKGYWDWLQSREPEIAFDAGKLKTGQDWIAAGERVFNAGTVFGPMFFGPDQVRDAAFYEKNGMPVAADGTIPFATWVVREKGKVELASVGCSTCHTRVMRDGTVIAGGQGNNPGDRQGAALLEVAARFAGREKVLAQARGFAAQFELPWMENDFNRQAREASLEEMMAAGRAIPPGVSARTFTSLYAPPQIPDLIGVKDRKFLDHTGFVRHNEPGDLMRYSSIAQDMIGYARFGDYPAAKTPQAGKGVRYSDAQLYALAQYLYSLKPPKNPHRPDAQSRRGRVVFNRSGCADCHTPPLYTNNKLIPAGEIGTDPRTALATRRGTGYYKVPSLLGVWYRGPFEHNGSVATLEDWFDAARLKDSYRPTGFVGSEGKPRAVKGHEYGLDLSPEDKRALIAFLRTL
ncbi:MAG: di-heme oxidoredictase family protein [Bryobacteraceae bacterium]|nr:di-heme oxidoredictase family protein [Bryobacteraceae bacterium]